MNQHGISVHNLEIYIVRFIENKSGSWRFHKRTRHVVNTIEMKNKIKINSLEDTENMNGNNKKLSTTTGFKLETSNKPEYKSY